MSDDEKKRARGLLVDCAFAVAAGKLSSDSARASYKPDEHYAVTQLERAACAYAESDQRLLEGLQARVAELTKDKTDLEKTLARYISLAEKLDEQIAKARAALA